MSTLKLDSDGDLAVEANALVILSDTVAEAAQRLKTKFRFFLGEWSLDPRVGFPLLQKVLVKNPNIPELRALFRETIIRDEAVDTLERLTLDFDGATRTLSMGFEATLVDGSTLTFSDFILGDYL